MRKFSENRALSLAERAFFLNADDSTRSFPAAHQGQPHFPAGFSLVRRGYGYSGDFLLGYGQHVKIPKAGSRLGNSQFGGGFEGMTG